MNNFDTVRVGLAVAINTIREALLDARSLLHDGRRQDKALTALSELEAMAGSQEPVAWMVTTELQDGTRSTYPLSGRYKDVRDACDFGEPVPLFAAPPAQQPQYEAGDMASAHNDGFRAGVASVAQQPQAEAVPDAVKVVIAAMQADPDYAWSWHCNVAMAFVDAGGDPYTANQGAARFMRLLANVDPAHELPTKQAEAVPSDKELEAIIYEHTKLNPNQAADRELIGYIINAIRAAQGAKP